MDTRYWTSVNALQACAQLVCHIFSHLVYLKDFIAVSVQTKLPTDHDKITATLLKLQTKEDSNGVTEIIYTQP